MSTFEIIVLGIVAVLAVAMLWFYAKSKNKIVKLLFGACSGIGVLFPAGYILEAVGYGRCLPVNVFTLSVSGILGIPGVALMAAIQLLA